MKVFVIGSISVPESDSRHQHQTGILRSTMESLGQNLYFNGHELLVCSPFPESADVEVVRGMATAVRGGLAPNIEFHYPNSVKIARELDQLEGSLGSLRFQRFVHPPPAEESGREALTYAWLLAQIAAMERSHAVTAIGGKSTGSMSLLLRLAEIRAWSQSYSA